jgi:hypothetical protein
MVPWLTVIVMLLFSVALASARLNWLTYDPAACGHFSAADVQRYVQANLKSDKRLCRLDRPSTWDNDTPYRVRVCNPPAPGQTYAEVYPDCGLEWRSS